MKKFFASSDNKTFNLYFCKGIDANGLMYNDIISSKKRDDIQISLQTNNIILLKITPIFRFNIISLRPRLIPFFDQLAVMLQTNISLIPALQTLASVEKKDLLRLIINKVIKQINTGEGLSKAMSQFPMLFTPSMLAFVQNGEQTGRLNTSIAKLSSLLINQQKIKSQIKKALNYPLFLLISTLFTGGGMIIFILPKYQSFFIELNAQLPSLTRMLLHTTLWLSTHFLQLLTSVLFGSLIFRFLLANPRFKIQWDRFKLKLPLLGSLIRTYALCQWAYVMALTHKANVPLLRSLALANDVLTNYFVKFALDKLYNDLKSGKSLHSSLMKAHVFGAIPLNMIRIGEASGTLGLVFSKIAENSELQLQTELNALIKTIEPTFMLVLAILAGILIAALYLPMITLGLTT